MPQKEFAVHSGLGLRFDRDLEQGKETARMDKVSQALAMFGMKAVPGRMNIESSILRMVKIKVQIEVFLHPAMMVFVKEGFILPLHHDCGSFVGNGSTVMGKEEHEAERAFPCNGNISSRYLAVFTLIHVSTLY